MKSLHIVRLLYIEIQCWSILLKLYHFVLFFVCSAALLFIIFFHYTRRIYIAWRIKCPYDIFFSKLVVMVIMDVSWEGAGPALLEAFKTKIKFIAHRFIFILFLKKKKTPLYLYLSTKLLYMDHIHTTKTITLSYFFYFIYHMWLILSILWSIIW